MTIVDPDMPIRWRLASVMADREMDYKALAELANLHPVTVNKLKNTFVAPPQISSQTLAKLCKALNCQPGDLMRFEPTEGDSEAIPGAD